MQHAREPDATGGSVIAQQCSHQDIVRRIHRPSQGYKMT
jgi:hypothetical protein